MRKIIKAVAYSGRRRLARIRWLVGERHIMRSDVHNYPPSLPGEPIVVLWQSIRSLNQLFAPKVAIYTDHIRATLKKKPTPIQR